MATNTTSTLSNSVRTQYTSDYKLGAMGARIYDQAANWPIGKPMSELMKGSSVQINFLGDLDLATSAISQVADISPVTFRDATASITPTSRANAVQDAELLEIQNFLNYSGSAGAKMQKLGKNQMLSVEVLAANAATQGGNVYRAAARTSLDAGTTGHNLTDTTFALAQARFQAMKVPSFMSGDESMLAGGASHLCFVPPDAYYDLVTGGNIVSIAQYQQGGIILNFELGTLGNFSIISSPWLKSFWGAGAANGSAIETTLSSAANNLAKQIVVASATNIDAGDKLLIGTHETGDTHYPTNEVVWVSADYTSGTTIDIIGSGDNGGLLYDHDSGEAVSNDDGVYPVVFAGSNSLAKLYATDYIGDAIMDESPYGAVVGPLYQGLVQQFGSVGWKFYGGYGRWNEAWLLRAEVSSSLDA